MYISDLKVYLKYMSRNVVYCSILITPAHQHIRPKTLSRLVSYFLGVSRARLPYRSSEECREEPSVFSLQVVSRIIWRVLPSCEHQEHVGGAHLPLQQAALLRPVLHYRPTCS